MVDRGVAMEQLVLDGMTEEGHVGLLRSFVAGGFVWVMLTIMAPGSGAPTDAQAFFHSARWPGPGGA